MTHQINIGMIGAGGIARSRHLPNLKKMEGVSLAAVANRTEESAGKIAEEFGFERVYGDWKQVVDDPQVNAVFICTPPYMHREMTLYALSRGKPVFCQARMAMNAEDALPMLEAARAAGLTTMLCPPPHYMKVEPVVRRLLVEGRIGEIRHVALIHLSSMFLDPQQPLHWRQRRDLQGINMLDVGIMGEVLQKWFGPVDALSAVGQTWVKDRSADNDGCTTVDLPDSVSIAGQFAGGATLTALFTGAVLGGPNKLEIYGTEGSLMCNATDERIVIRDQAGEHLVEVHVQEQGFWTVELDFIHAVREGKQAEPSFETGMQYMRFTQAVWESVHSGNRVRL